MNKNKGLVNLYNIQSSPLPRVEATILMLLAIQGEFAFVEQMLKSGENPLPRNAYNKTAGDLAAEKGFTQTADLLYAAEQKALTAKMFKAIEVENLSDMKDCITAGIKMNGLKVLSPDAPSVTFLTYAAAKTHTLALGVLLDAKADVHEPDASGTTALHYTCRQDNVEGTAKLLEHKANPFKKNEKGTSPEDVAIGISKNLVEHIKLTRENEVLKKNNYALTQENRVLKIASAPQLASLK